MILFSYLAEHKALRTKSHEVNEVINCTGWDQFANQDPRIRLTWVADKRRFRALITQVQAKHLVEMLNRELANIAEFDNRQGEE